MLAIILWCLALAACLAGLCWVLSSDGREFRDWQRKVHTRKPIADEELAACLKNDYVSTDIVSKVRHAFAKHTGFLAENILLDDDFQPYVCDLDADQFMEILQQELDQPISGTDAAMMRPTVRSVSQVIADMNRKWKCNAHARVMQDAAEITASELKK